MTHPAIERLIRVVEDRQIARPKGHGNKHQNSVNQAIADLELLLIPDYLGLNEFALAQRAVFKAIPNLTDPIDVQRHYRVGNLLGKLTASLSLTQPPTDDSPLTHNSDNDSPDRETIAPPGAATSECPKCDRGRIAIPCPDGKRGCAVYHYRICETCQGTGVASTKEVG